MNKQHKQINMDISNNNITIRLWIVRWQRFLANFFHSKIFASVLMFYIPIIISGYILQIKSNYPIFSANIHIALLWIAIAPFLIQKAFEAFNNFFQNQKNIFQSREQWKKHYLYEINRIQSKKYILFGIPWSVSTSLIILYANYKDVKVDISIKIWHMTSFFLLFFISAIGFYGIYVMITMLNNICCDELLFNPFHPDRLGGIREFSKFSVKASLYFSSGALVIPLAIEIIKKCSPKFYYLKYTSNFLFGVFIMTMLAGFFIPIFKLKQFINKKKQEALIQSHEKLDNLIDEFNETDELFIKKGIAIALHYYLNYSKINEIKDYPFDLKILSEFSLSFILPLLVTIIEHYFITI